MCINTYIYIYTISRLTNIYDHIYIIVTFCFKLKLLRLRLTATWVRQRQQDGVSMLPERDGNGRATHGLCFWIHIPLFFLFATVFVVSVQRELFDLFVCVCVVDFA